MWLQGIHAQCNSFKDSDTYILEKHKKTKNNRKVIQVF